MTRPKGKLFALVAIFAAIALVAATGAFSTVQADRSTNVTVAGDSAALLGLDAADTDNGGYASVNNGQLSVALNTSATQVGSGNVQGNGVNQDALTEVEYVFNITNQGSQDVDVYITKTGDDIDAVQFFDGPITSSNNITTSSQATTVTPGSTVSVSIKIDTTGTDDVPEDQLVSEITVHAEAPDDGNDT